MTKYLNGAELAGYIKERQAKSVRMLMQAHNIRPKLAVVLCGDNQLSQKYIKYKSQYAKEIGIEVELLRVTPANIVTELIKLENDHSTHGVIVQLPLPRELNTDQIIELIPVAKDVDGLKPSSSFTPATAQAIIWLLNGYNIELQGKNVVVIGKGRLVGAPLTEMLKAEGVNVISLDESNADWLKVVNSADVLISATGQPSLIKSAYIAENAVLVDAGSTVEEGVIRGDFDEDLYTRDDLTITPKIGGVGPLTICSLFENLIIACTKLI